MKKIFFIISILYLPSFCQENIALFPLKNQSNDKLVEWIGYSFPEFFFRKFSEVTAVGVWDPVFLFSADSAGWQMGSDSLLLIHKNRWKWDYAIGGYYTVDKDTLRITMVSVSLEGNKIAYKKKTVRVREQSHVSVLGDLFLSLCSLLQVKITARDSIELRKGDGTASAVYATYVMGYGYEMLDQISNAISAYNRVIQMDELFASAYFRIGVLYGKSRKRDEALKFCEKAFALSPHSPLIAAEMALALMHSGDHGKAMPFIESNARVLERNVAGMKAIGMSYIVRGEYQRAVSILTRALAEGPSDLETDFILGRTYLSLGQYANAADIFGRLIKYRPQYTRYYSFLGEAYREAGRLMESCDVLENATRLDPDNVPNLISLASTYFKLGWNEKAEQYLLRAKNLNPDMGEILINLGTLYWHMGRKNEAQKMFEQAVQSKISVQSALNNQANVLFLSGDVKRAIKIYKKADAWGKKSEVILYNLAIACLSAGKIKDAVSFLDEVLLIAPDRIDILMLQAQLALQRERSQDAEIYYRKVLDLSPGNRAVIIKLIDLYEKNGRLKEAVAVVENYLADFPQDRDFKLKLPDLYRGMGWYEVAEQEYQNLKQDRDYKDDIRVYLGLGRCQYDIIRFKSGKEYEKAIFTLKTASQIDPMNPEPDIIIGSIYMDFKNYRELALEHWQQAYNKSGDPEERKKIKGLMEGTGK